MMLQLLRVGGRTCAQAAPTCRLLSSAKGGGARPFEILGVQHIAIGGLDKEELTSLWCDRLGLQWVDSFKSEAENVDEDILRLGSGVHAVEIDLMQPLDPEKPPKVHMPPLNHLGLWVHPLRACVEHLSSQGVRFAGGIRRGAGGHEVAFIHPKGNEKYPQGGGGVLIELVQATPEVIEAKQHGQPSSGSRGGGHD